jgi:anti-sigma-28 factor FlgM
MDRPQRLEYLRLRVERGTYQCDASAVAEAMLRHPGAPLLITTATPARQLAAA